MEITIERRSDPDILLEGSDVDRIEFRWEDKDGEFHKIRISEGVHVERDGLKISSGASSLTIKPNAANLISISSKD